MLNKFNEGLEKWLPLITPTCVFLGVTIAAGLKDFAYLVPWIFAFMSFSSSLGLGVGDVRKTIKNPVPIIICIVILQVIMPVLAFYFGKVVFGHDIYIITGIVLAFAIPTGIVSLMWVTIFNGNRALTLSIILINTMLAPLIIPITLKVLIGTRISLDTFGMMNGLFWMIVFPTILGLIMNILSKKKTEQLRFVLSPFSKLALICVILLNSSVVSSYFREIDLTFLMIAFIIFNLALLGYLFGLLFAKLFRWDYDTKISLVFNSGMRNIAVGAALATAYFPPAVALPIVITILFQQVLASLFGRYLSRNNKQKQLVESAEMF